MMGRNTVQLKCDSCCKPLVAASGLKGPVGFCTKRHFKMHNLTASLYCCHRSRHYGSRHGQAGNSGTVAPLVSWAGTRPVHCSLDSSLRTAKDSALSAMDAHMPCIALRTQLHGCFFGTRCNLCCSQGSTKHARHSRPCPAPKPFVRSAPNQHHRFCTHQAPCHRPGSLAACNLRPPAGARAFATQAQQPCNCNTATATMTSLLAGQHYA